jgi:hypothetical protein
VERAAADAGPHGDFGLRTALVTISDVWGETTLPLAGYMTRNIEPSIPSFIEVFDEPNN